MIARASGAPLRTQQLNDALHRLHARASSPAVKTIAAACGLGGGTIHRLFSSPALPKPNVLLPVVEFLAKQCRNADPDEECDRFDAMWQRALDEWVPNPFPEPGDGDPDEGPETGPCPAGGGPGPSTGPAGAGSTPAEPGDTTMADSSDRDEPAPTEPEILDPATSRALFFVTYARDASPNRDVTGLHDHFAKHLGWGTDLIINPTRRRIWNALTDAASSTSGALLVYFLGHGIRDERSSDRDYLVAADVRHSDEGWVDNVVSVRDVRRVLAAAGSRQSLLILDCCFGDGGPRDGLPARVIPDFSPPSILLEPEAHGDDPPVARPAFVAGYRGGAESGVFTSALLKVLKARRDDPVPLASLLSDVKRILPHDSADRLSVGAVNGGGHMALTPCTAGKPAYTFTGGNDLRELAREGLLTVVAQTMPDRTRRLFRAQAIELVWPIVFERLTRRRETSRGHVACTDGVRYLEPACFDRFQDDVDAVLEDMFRNARQPIGDLEGWLNSRLTAGAVDAHRRRRGERAASQRPRLPAWLATALGHEPRLAALAWEIVGWLQDNPEAGKAIWPFTDWADDRTALADDVATILAAMQRRHRWYEEYVQRPFGDKLLMPREERLSLADPRR